MNPEKELGRIRAELVATHFYTRYACHACGGATEKVAVLCEVPKSHPTHGGFRVCEQCLQAGNLAARMKQYAADLEAQAAELRALAGRVDTPSYDEWVHACHVHDALEISYRLGHDLPDFAEVMAWPRERRDALMVQVCEATS